MSRTGRADGRLVVLRGPSRAGKSSVAMALRELPMSVVEQDHLRRIILKERDSRENTDVLELLDLTVRFCLDRGRDVVLEGILNRPKYGGMIERLLAAHRGTNHVYYLRVPLADTIRRHEASGDAPEWTAEDMRGWWTGHDPLGVPGEVVLDATQTHRQVLARIRADLR